MTRSVVLLSTGLTQVKVEVEKLNNLSKKLATEKSTLVVC